jgi:hypothetical protein
MTIRILTLITGVVLLGVSYAAADTVYTYTGNDFTTATSPYTTSDSITGSFTVATPLGDNLVDSVIDPSSFTFSDGVNTITTANAVSDTFEVSTNASGAIISWSISIIGSTSDLQTYNVPGDPDFISDAVPVIGPHHGTLANNTLDPGTWTVSVPLAPLPLYVQLTVITLGALGLFGFRKMRKNAAAITNA